VDWIDSGVFVRDVRCLIRRCASFFDRPDVRAALSGLMADIAATNPPDKRDRPPRDPRPASASANSSL
jgi:hypothetical protein